MGVLGRLEGIILATKLPPWAIAAASAPLTFAITYFAANQPGRAVIEAPPAAVAAVVAMAVAYPVNWHFQDKATLKELGIDEKKLSGKKPEQLHSGIARRALNCLMQPKSSALFLTAALEAGRIYALGINDKILHSTSNLSDFVNYGLPAISFEAGIAAVFGFASYHFTKITYRITGKGGPRQAAKLLKAAASPAKSRISQLEKIAGETPSQYASLRLAEEYISSGNFDKAAQHIKEAASQSQKAILPGIELKDFVSSIITSRHRKWKKRKENITYAVEIAAFCDHAGSAQKADEILGEMAAAADSAEASAIAAWWTGTVFGRKDAARNHWAAASEHLIGNSKYAIEPTGEGIHKVYRIGPSFIKDDIIMKAETRQDAEFESRMLDFVSGIPKGRNYTSPNKLAIIRSMGEYVLVMSYLRGSSLLEKARRKEASSEDISRAIEYLSILHKYVPPEMSTKGKISLKQKLKEITCSTYLGMPEEWQGDVLRNFEFVADRLSATKTVFAQDAHPGQWQYTSTQLAKLDHNDNGVDTLFRDLAKLSGHPDMALDAANLDVFQQEAFKIYSNAGIIRSSKTQFMINFLQARIMQALSFAAAWSVPEMQHMRGKREHLVAGTQSVLDIIRQNHASHYYSNRISYNGLEASFRQLREHMAAA